MAGSILSRTRYKAATRTAEEDELTPADNGGQLISLFLSCVGSVTECQQPREAARSLHAYSGRELASHPMQVIRAKRVIPFPLIGGHLSLYRIVAGRVCRRASPPLGPNRGFLTESDRLPRPSTGRVRPPTRAGAREAGRLDDHQP